MTSIAVLHYEIRSKGGGEAVCLHTLAALAEKHDVRFLTPSKIDLDAYADFYGVDLPTREIEMIVPKRGAFSPESIRRGRDALPPPTGILKQGIYSAWHWLCEPYFRDADVVINTKSEMGYRWNSAPIIAYVHEPMLNRFRSSDPEVSWYDLPPKKRSARALNDLVLQIEGLPVPRDHPSTGLLTPTERRGKTDESTVAYLTNSQFMRNYIEKMYAIDVSVVSPPVDTRRLSGGPPAGDRERGAIIFGRIDPDKHVHKAINIIEDIRTRGHDIHLHIVGKRGSEAYATEIEERAVSTDYIEFEGEVSRERLRDLLHSHRYAIHAKPKEHFGITVAEMVTAGLLPIVPAGGGQQEIVNNQPQLCYTNRDDAVEKFCRLLEDPSFETELRANLPDIEAAYGVERFHEAMQAVVADRLSAEVGGR